MPTQGEGEPKFPKRETQLFGPMMTPGRARLVLIRGTGTALPGLSFHLNATSHACGRDYGVILFDEDKTVSPKHGRFFYEDARLYVEDAESANGTFVKIKEPRRLKNHDRILVGEQLFEFQYLAVEDEYGTDDGTLAYISPVKPFRFRLVQILAGGREGIVATTPGNDLSIGREGCDLNFDDDKHMSGRHARISHDAQGFQIEDLDSRNGTYVRVREPEQLGHGDYVWLGEQLLRVEITT
jgi:pSer/pThr/pTyr-binding forkhead associated (FHA) protein